MKGIILAGGRGTRLLPLTKVTNKHLLPVGEYPMLYYPIKKLKQAGIKEIMIVVGIEHCGSVMSLLGSGKEFGCSFTYKVQDKPDGIAGALKLCKNFVGKDRFAVILGDNIFNESIESQVSEFKESKNDCMLFFKEVDNPKRFGVAKFNNKNELIDVIEKPEDPPSNYACIGIYFYSSKVFDVLDKIKISKRGEFEISDVNSYFIGTGRQTYSILKDIWTDAGTIDSYKKTNTLVYDNKLSIG